MRVRYWGTRGSIATPGPATLRYGGNTSCVEVVSSRGTRLVLDCGTGARGLGRALARESDGARGGALMITHTHWDHIQGFPFFEPFFAAGQRWDVYGPRDLGATLRETLAGQMQYRYFPIAPEQFEAEIEYRDLAEGEFAIDDFRITARYLNHPALTLGYRIEADGATLVYATDHEPHGSQVGGGSQHRADADDAAHLAFIADADLLIHDAQYTDAEYDTRVGWGHTPIEFAVDAAAEAGARRLALFHHDPTRDDDTLDALIAAVQTRPSCARSGLELSAAAEGSGVEIVGPGTPRRDRTPAAAAPSAVEAPLPLRQPALVALDPHALGESVAQTLRSDRLVVEKARGADAVRAATARELSLILLSPRLGDEDASDLTRELRAMPGCEETPIVVVAEDESELDTAAWEAAGVTDWLVAPFKPTYLRARLRCWLLRRACRWQPAPEPPDEARRLEALRSLEILDTPPDERFDRLTRIATALFDVPVALVSLVDADRQWFKSHQGLDVSETPREMAFCSHAILTEGPMVVNDADRDDRFADNPLVTGPPHVRFYAGAPLEVGDGGRVGTLCLLDHRPRSISQTQLDLLRDLAELVERELGRGHELPTTSRV